MTSFPQACGRFPHIVGVLQSARLTEDWVTSRTSERFQQAGEDEIKRARRQFDALNQDIAAVLDQFMTAFRPFLLRARSDLLEYGYKVTIGKISWAKSGEYTSTDFTLDVNVRDNFSGVEYPIHLICDVQADGVQMYDKRQIAVRHSGTCQMTFAAMLVYWIFRTDWTVFRHQRDLDLNARAVA